LGRGTGAATQLLFLVSANADHGYRRTNEDKRRAVDIMLGDAEWVAWSDSELARRCAVSDEMVRKRRLSIVQPLEDRSSRLVIRGGTTYPMNTTNIGTGAPAGEAEPAPRFSGRELRCSRHVSGGLRRSWLADLLARLKRKLLSERKTTA
jgi:hypothetical protein